MPYCGHDDHRFEVRLGTCEIFVSDGSAQAIITLNGGSDAIYRVRPLHRTSGGWGVNTLPEAMKYVCRVITEAQEAKKHAVQDPCEEMAKFVQGLKNGS